jgi:hypothetical protein
LDGVYFDVSEIRLTIFTKVPTSKNYAWTFPDFLTFLYKQNDKVRLPQKKKHSALCLNDVIKIRGNKYDFKVMECDKTVYCFDLNLCIIYSHEHYKKIYIFFDVKILILV